MNRQTCTVMVLLLAAAVLVALAGCFKADVNVGYGRARPVPGNIPPGQEHQVCRDEMAKAIERIDKLQHDLDNCRADKRKVEVERDRFKDERDAYRKRYGRLPGWD